LFLGKKRVSTHARFEKNQYLWRHFSDKMSFGIDGIFSLTIMVTFRRIPAFLQLMKMEPLQEAWIQHVAYIHQLW